MIGLSRSSMAVTVLIALALVGVVIVAFSGVTPPPADSSVQQGKPEAALQVPPMPTEAATVDPSQPTPTLPIYPTLPASPGPITPMPTSGIPTFTPGIPESERNFEAPATAPPYTPALSPRPEDPFHLVGTGTRWPFTIEEYTKRATVIVVGTIKQIGPAQWTTLDGSRPANPHGADLESGHLIITPVQVQVDSYLKGTQPVHEVLLMAVGGTVGQDSVEILTDGLYTFQQDEQVVVFLDHQLKAGQVQTIANRPLWRILEHYTIKTDGTATNSYNNIATQELLEKIRLTQGKP